MKKHKDFSNFKKNNKIMHFLNLKKMHFLNLKKVVS